MRGLCKFGTAVDPLEDALIAWLICRGSVERAASFDVWRRDERLLVKVPTGLKERGRLMRIVTVATEERVAGRTVTDARRASGSVRHQVRPDASGSGEVEWVVTDQRGGAVHPEWTCALTYGRGAP